MHIVLYEDSQWRRLRPLTDLLPVPALAFGASDLARRWLARTGGELVGLEARAEALAAWPAAPAIARLASASGGLLRVINAAALPGPWFEEAAASEAPALWLSAGRVVGAQAPATALRAGMGRGEDFETVLLSAGLPAREVAARVIEWPWHLIDWNPEAIREDLAGVAPDRLGRVHATACLEGAAPIVIAASAEVGAFAVLDSSEGPIRVGEGARIAAHTVVRGPCAIGRGTQLLGGVISHSTFGPECRIAGEVEASVWQGHGNKRHHGFVGHSALGEWVNLGALTTTSDLKNNYGSVRLRIDGHEVDSGSPKVGAVIGAHAKTGIGTLLPTGAVVGCASHVFGGGRFTPKSVASFAWWDGERTSEHDLERCIATARIVLGRRGRVLGPGEEAALRGLFASTARERLPMTGGG